MSVELRPIEDGDLDRMVEIISEPGVARWWGPVADPQTLRDDLHSEGSAFAVLVDGGVAGWLGYEEELTEGYRHVSLDIMLAVEHQGKGLGRAALRSAVRHFAARGHHRFTIDPAVDNARAIRTYEAVGFRPVGVMRAYELGTDGRYHDNLLMDLLVGELREA